MKKYIILFLTGCIITLIVIFGFSSPSSGDLQTTGLQVPNISTPAITFEDLLDAIEWVESKGDPNAVGDGGNAIGAYQIHKIYVDDVNRIMQLFMDEMQPDIDAGRITSAALVQIDGVMYNTLFSYDDRLDKDKSRAMTGIYLFHYGENKSFEDMARIHNGGPTGYRKESTLSYWEKIKERLSHVK